MKAKKQLIAGLLAGFLVAGGAGIALTASAERGYDRCCDRDGYGAWCRGPGMMSSAVGFCGMPGPGMHTDRSRVMSDRYVSSSEQAKEIADFYGVSASEVKEAIEDQVPYRRIDRAAFLAKASGKSFRDVLRMKTDENRWRDVEDRLQLTDEQYRETYIGCMARGIATRCGMDAGQARTLLDEGYHPMDIDAASRIARAANADIRAVLDKKTIRNDWDDVAELFGLDEDSLDDLDDGDDRDDRRHRYEDRCYDGYGHGRDRHCMERY